MDKQMMIMEELKQVAGGNSFTDYNEFININIDIPYTPPAIPDITHLSIDVLKKVGLLDSNTSLF